MPHRSARRKNRRAATPNIEIAPAPKAAPKAKPIATEAKAKKKARKAAAAKTKKLSKGSDSSN